MCLEIIISSTIGILALLVMLLIGWQIYALIDIRKLRKEIDEKRQHVIWESEHNMLISSMALADFYYSSVVDEPFKDKAFKYLFYRISAILHASRIKDYETCNVSTKILLETIEDELRISQYNKQLLVDLLLQIKAQREIVDFQNLLQKILKIQEIQ